MSQIYEIEVCPLLGCPTVLRSGFAFWKMSINFKCLTYFQWSTPNKDQLPTQGRVFRITFRCERRRREGEIIDCIMLKSNGTVQSEFGIKSITDNLTRCMITFNCKLASKCFEIVVTLVIVVTHLP